MAHRKSVTKTEAGERAQRAADEATAREEHMLELADKFFIAQGDTEQIMETPKQRIAKICSKAEQEYARQGIKGPCDHRHEGRASNDV